MTWKVLVTLVRFVKPSLIEVSEVLTAVDINMTTMSPVVWVNVGVADVPAEVVAYSVRAATVGAAILACQLSRDYLNWVFHQPQAIYYLLFTVFLAFSVYCFPW